MDPTKTKTQPCPSPLTLLAPDLGRSQTQDRHGRWPLSFAGAERGTAATENAANYLLVVNK